MNFYIKIGSSIGTISQDCIEVLVIIILEFFNLLQKKKCLNWILCGDEEEVHFTY